MIRTGDEGRGRHVGAIRAFNRFYTRQIGLLEDGVYRSEFSLAEARVLYELGRRGASGATAIAKSLDLDQGYLSRMVAKFVKQGLLLKTPAASDRRHYALKLTSKGRAAFKRLDRRSDDQVAKMTSQLTEAGMRRMVGAMTAIEQALTGHPAEKSSAAKPYLLREHRPGDMGWVVARHGELYASERRWDLSFEALVAEIVASFIRGCDPSCERCWIAEIDGERVGSVFLVRESRDVAKLRLLLVEPKARGLGLGRQLVEECVRFARQHGYKKISLWTQSILTAARGVYAQAGFRRVGEERHSSFGHDLVGERWELDL